MAFKDFSVGIKICALLALFAAASGASGIYATAQMTQISARYDTLINSNGNASTYVARARRAAFGVMKEMYQNITSSSHEMDVSTEERRLKEESAFNDFLEKAQVSSQTYADRIEAIQLKFNAAINGRCATVVSMSKAAADPDANARVAKFMDTECEPILTGLSDELKSLNEEMIDATERLALSAKSDAGSASRSTLLSIVLSSGLIFAIAFWVARKYIAAPLAALMTTMGELGKGNLTVEVPNRDQQDEIGAIANAVGDLREKLAAAEELRNQQAKLQREREERQRVVSEAIQKFQGTIGAVVFAVSNASGQLEQSAQSLTQTAGTTQQLSTAVASASEQTSTNVQGVAAASEELASTVSEIARQVQESANITDQAVRQAEKTNGQVSQLSEAANRIGDVVNLINSIAGQTNLLALNATIEAARAGDAGKGFAVVAQEVKALAAQTAKATNEIAAQIASMQGATTEAVTAIHEISVTINKVSSISGAIAAAVEEQEATTKEITRNVAEAARGTSEVAGNITDVNKGAVETGAASTQVLSSAKQLALESEKLSQEVDVFLQSIRVA